MILRKATRVRSSTAAAQAPGAVGDAGVALSFSVAFNGAGGAGMGSHVLFTHRSESFLQSLSEQHA